MTARTVEQVEREQAQAYKSGDMPLALTLHNERMAIAREAQRDASKRALLATLNLRTYSAQATR
jgi:hypothetical protein